MIPPLLPGLPIIRSEMEWFEAARSLSYWGEQLRQLLGLSFITPMFLGRDGLTIAAGSTTFLGINAVSPTEGNVQTAAPRRLVLGDLRVRTTPAPGAGESYTFTVRKGGTDTPIVAAVTGTGAEGSDLSNLVTVDEGDLLSIKLVTSAGAAQLTGFQLSLNMGLQLF